MNHIETLKRLIEASGFVAYSDADLGEIVLYDETQQALTAAIASMERMEEVKRLLGELRMLLRSYDSGKLNSATWRGSMDYVGRIHDAIDSARKEAK